MARHNLRSQLNNGKVNHSAFITQALVEFQCIIGNGRSTDDVHAAVVEHGAEVGQGHGHR